MRKEPYSMKMLEEEKLLLMTEIDLCADDFKNSLGNMGSSFKNNFVKTTGISTALMGLSLFGIKKIFSGSSKNKSQADGNNLLLTLLPIGLQFIQSYLRSDQRDDKAA